jgi:hypothetical protein
MPKKENKINKNIGIALKSPVLTNIKENVVLEENNTQIGDHNSKFRMRQQH